MGLYDPVPGELITAASDGRWLGDFAAEYAASSWFDTLWPVGFAGSTWFETEGCLVWYDGCDCRDCCSTGADSSTVNYEQLFPGDPVDECGTPGGATTYAVAITPKRCDARCARVLYFAPCTCIPGDAVR